MFSTATFASPGNPIPGNGVAAASGPPSPASPAPAGGSRAPAAWPAPTGAAAGAGAASGLRSSRDAYFDVGAKQLYDLFFVGKVGGEGALCNRSCTDSMAYLVEAQARGLRACSSCYSSGVRQWFYRHWRGHPRMLIAATPPRGAPR